MNGDVLIRPAGDRDWDAIADMEAAAYGELGLSEGREALRSRAEVSPETCFVLEADGRAVGYLLALPYPAGRYPDLRQSETTAFVSRNLHLHDLVVAPPFRGGGMARRLLEHVAGTARTHGYEQLSLVAVGDSEGFWSSCGFTAHPRPVTAGGYGSTAVYMSAPVPVHGPRPSPPHESS
ncbi:GNAT family N-acetyltransferase [Streptomyces sp. NBC_00525]|uniref:GNAT family N-acetyltransferase n=1 Tax=Streptomyces sp. NBC_00525 TaxID=2903660 RepID=UPI002E813EEF|nr:GNAT family N-acetyltransferase [Streptomyces sp. NBC_00525]WUC94188.1 GNAT family N-acetyltransferase [Streptomyces sp. NBC_00525]